MAYPSVIAHQDSQWLCLVCLVRSMLFILPKAFRGNSISVLIYLPASIVLHFSSISHSVPSAAMDNVTDPQRLATIIRMLQRLDPPGSSSNQLAQQITLARSIIRALDQASLLQRVGRLEEQVHIISRLQDLAYYEPDSGGISDIAQWCMRHWLRLLQEPVEHVGVFQGLSYHHLLRH